MKIFTITLLVIFLFVLLLFIDFRLGQKRHTTKVKKVTFPKRSGHLHLFTSGPILLETLFADISHAKHHVHVQFYILKNDKISKQFLALLKKKSEEGIEVRLLLDRIGSFYFKKNQIEKLKASGVKFSFCQSPKFPFLFHSLQERNHRKITIIDGKIGYIGGFNIAKEYINEKLNLSPWRDYHLKVIGEGVQDLQKQFLEDWSKATQEHIQYEEIYVKEGKKGEHQYQLVPTEGAFLEKEFLSLIHTAKHSIFIGTPYFIPSDLILRSLCHVLSKGISLTIIVPHKSDHLFVKEAAYPYFRKLLPLGAKVYQYQKGFFHAKYIVIDDYLVDIGTANFDKRSLFLNHEINCYVTDKSSISKIKKEVLEDINNSTPLLSRQLQNLPFRDILKERVGTFISSLL